MSLATLIKKGGLSNHATATVATLATEQAIGIESVARVAKVAVITSLTLLTFEQNLIEFVQRCCIGLAADAQQVINLLLSLEDEQDIINGKIPRESLITAIRVWTANASPHLSGKSIVIKESINE